MSEHITITDPPEAFRRGKVPVVTRASGWKTGEPGVDADRAAKLVGMGAAVYGDPPKPSSKAEEIPAPRRRRRQEGGE